MTEGISPQNSGAGSQALWSACLDRLAREIPEQQFNTWIRPLSATVSDDASKVVVAVANRFKMDWIRAQYSTRISALLQDIQGSGVLLELALTPREGPSRTSPASRSVQDQVLAELPDIAPVEV
uniref:DnaA N-terminal domain-containing protein n=1 Tax=Hydrogenophaga sp. TaxID=1904254 RepID=UPI003566F1CE